MKILLVNENPVVTKLVTLSAQKTSDTLDVVSSVDAIGESLYDLVVIDDGVFSEALFEELETVVSFSHSLFICSRETSVSDLFTHTLKKPFLPTDLVDIFANVGVESGDMDLDDLSDDLVSLPEDIDVSAGLEELAFDEMDEELDFDEELNLNDELTLDDEELNLDDDLALEDDLALGDEELMDEDSFGESILDTEEAQKVKDLLEETSEDDGLLDEFLFDELEEDKPQEDMFDLEAEIAAMSETQSEPLEDEILEDDLMQESFEDEELLGAEIQDAIDSLSDEDLNSEFDDDMLEGLEGVSAKDLKLAIGEELQGDEESLEALDKMDDLDTFDMQSCCDEDESQSIEDDAEALEGVEALKNLLAALSDKKVAASMKGMQITINITLGVK